MAHLAGYVGSVHINPRLDATHYRTEADVCVRHNYAHYGYEVSREAWFTVQITGIKGGEPDKSAEYLKKGDFIDLYGAWLPTPAGCRLLCDGRYTITKK